MENKPTEQKVRQMELPPEFEDSLNHKIRALFNKLWEEKQELLKTTVMEKALEDIMAEAPNVDQTYEYKPAHAHQKKPKPPLGIPTGFAPSSMIAKYLEQLKQAKLKKDQPTARHCRAMLRSMGWNVSVHGYKPPNIGPVLPQKPSTIQNANEYLQAADLKAKKVSGSQLDDKIKALEKLIQGGGEKNA